jgi:CDGSH-type Zn-finger protein
LISVPSGSCGHAGKESVIFMEEPVVYQKAPIVQKVEPGTYWWCACGRSASQPFCDGSHAGTGLGPVKAEIKVAGTVAWCACKHSKAMPFCDGSHARLP